MSHLVLAGFAALLFLSAKVHAQTNVLVPPILLGVWHNDMMSACDAKAEALGITVTPVGEIVENNGAMVCKIEQLKMDEVSAPVIASWSYEGACTVQGSPANRIPLYGRMWVTAEKGKPSVLERQEDQASFGSLWDRIPQTRRMGIYRRCP